LCPPSESWTHWAIFHSGGDFSAGTLFIPRVTTYFHPHTFDQPRPAARMCTVPTLTRKSPCALFDRSLPSAMSNFAVPPMISVSHLHSVTILRSLTGHVACPRPFVTRTSPCSRDTIGSVLWRFLCYFPTRSKQSCPSFLLTSLSFSPFLLISPFPRITGSSAKTTVSNSSLLYA